MENDLEYLLEKVRKAGELMEELCTLTAQMAAVPDGDVYGKGVMGGMRLLGMRTDGDNYVYPRNINTSRRDLAIHVHRASGSLESLGASLTRVMESVDPKAFRLSA